MATGQGRDGRPPIEEIAQALGISKTTVSRALSGKGRVSEETRAKVFAYVGRRGLIAAPQCAGRIPAQHTIFRW